MFPESCRDVTLSDKTTYPTMIRIAGSFESNGPVFEAILHYYGWTHVVVVSDSAVAPCLYGATPIYDHLSNRDNYTVYWYLFTRVGDPDLFRGHRWLTNSRRGFIEYSNVITTRWYRKSKSA